MGEARPPVTEADRITVMRAGPPAGPRHELTHFTHAALTKFSMGGMIIPRVANPSASHRCPVVDDEPNVVDVISTALRFQGFDVISAGTGSGALARGREVESDLVVLDVTLPTADGFEAARRFRADRSGTLIIVVTARDGMSDKIHGAPVGGDGDMTEAFSTEDLLARARTALRGARDSRPESNVLRFEDIVLDDDAHQVLRGGQSVSLTATEYRLLRYLMLNPERVLSRAQLLEHVWSYDFGGDARVLQTYVSYLRKKLDVHGPPLIQTVRGVGYVLRPPRT